MDVKERGGDDRMRNADSGFLNNKTFERILAIVVFG